MARWVYIDIDEILKETDKAFLVRIADEEIWLPFSQLADPDDYSEGDMDLEDVAITEWIAREKELDFS